MNLMHRYLPLDVFRRSFRSGAIARSAHGLSFAKEVGSVPALLKAGPCKVERLHTDDASRPAVRMRASDARVDRGGDSICVGGWEIENFKANPVFVWCHETGSMFKAAEAPIGRARATEAIVAQNGADEASAGLFHDIEFTPKDLNPFGFMIGRMFEEGFMSASSIGMLPIEANFASDRAQDFFEPLNFTRQELLETSAVPVPMHPGALAEGRSRGIEMDAYVGWTERVLDGDVAGPGVSRAGLEAIRQEARGAPAQVVVPETVKAPQLDAGALIRGAFDLALRKNLGQ